MTAKTVNRRVEEAAQAAGLGGHAAGPMMQQYDGGEVHPRGVGARWLEWRGQAS